MKMESLRKKAKEAIRAVVLGGTVVAGAAASESAMNINNAEAQTVQGSDGPNSPNVIGGGNVTILGTGKGGKPNISERREGPNDQRSTGPNSPNVIIEEGDVVIIDGEVVYPKKK